MTESKLVMAALYVTLILIGVVIGLLIKTLRQRHEEEDGAESCTANSTKYYTEEQMRQIAEVAYEEGRATGVLVGVPTFGIVLTDVCGMEREDAEDITNAMSKAWIKRLKEHGYKDSQLQKIKEQADKYLMEVWRDERN